MRRTRDYEAIINYTVSALIVDRSSAQAWARMQAKDGISLAETLKSVDPRLHGATRISYNNQLKRQVKAA